MNERRDPIDAVRQNKWLRLFWAGLTLLFACLAALAFIDFYQGEAKLDHVLLPASMFLLGMVHVLLITGALRIVLYVLTFILLIWSYVIMFSR